MRIERWVTLPTDLDRAWELLTGSDEVAGWLGAEVRLDPTPGASGLVVEHDGTARRLVVQEAEAGHHLTWHWWREDAPEETSRVQITLTPVDGGTSVQVVEELIGSPASSPSASSTTGEAWSHRLLHLEALLLVAAAVRG